jgi:aspartate beta-hydroxylase
MDEAQLDQLLRHEPWNVMALVQKGRCRLSAGDHRGAVPFFKSALHWLARRGNQPEDAPWIRAAEEGMAEAGRLFESHLEAALTRNGFPRDRRPGRFQDSLDILMGRRSVRLELQRPGGYYYPGLPQRRYYERHEFAWAAELEALTPMIREELMAWLAQEDRFSPYMVSDPSRPPGDFHGLVDNPDWSTLYLWQNGAPVAEHVARCPRTFEAMQAVDLPFITTRAPAVLFSRLAAGARIPPHSGVMNARLICHLPLVVPPGCAFRVGGEVREWREGELLIFDDSIEHEAWNDGASDRIVLIFDVWRPELTADERQAVAALFAAVDSYAPPA